MLAHINRVKGKEKFPSDLIVTAVTYSNHEHQNLGFMAQMLELFG